MTVMTAVENALAAYSNNELVACRAKALNVISHSESNALPHAVAVTVLRPHVSDAFYDSGVYSNEQVSTETIINLGHRILEGVISILHFQPLSNHQPSSNLQTQALLAALIRAIEDDIDGITSTVARADIVLAQDFVREHPEIPSALNPTDEALAAEATDSARAVSENLCYIRHENEHVQKVLERVIKQGMQKIATRSYAEELSSVTSGNFTTSVVGLNLQANRLIASAIAETYSSHSHPYSRGSIDGIPCEVLDAAREYTTRNYTRDSITTGTAPDDTRRMCQEALELAELSSSSKILQATHTIVKR